MGYDGHRGRRVWPSFCYGGIRVLADITTGVKGYEIPRQPAHRARYSTGLTRRGCHNPGIPGSPQQDVTRTRVDSHLRHPVLRIQAHIPRGCVDREQPSLNARSRSLGQPPGRQLGRKSRRENPRNPVHRPQHRGSIIE